MKKLLALTLAVLTIFSCSAVAAAAEVTNAGTQTLTINYTEPTATYTLNIPANATIDLANNDLSVEYATVTESANFWGKRLEVLMQPDGFTNENDSVTNALYNFTMTLEDGTTVDDLLLTFGYLSDESTGALASAPQHSTKTITDMDLHFYIGAGPAFQNAIEGLEYTSTILFNAAVVDAGETSPFAQEEAAE